MNVSSEPPNDASKPPNGLGLRLAIVDGIEFSQRSTGASLSYVALDTRSGKFYRFGAREYHAASMMDGSIDLSEVHRRLNVDGVPWSGDEVVSFARQLVQSRLAEVVTSGGPMATLVSPKTGGGGNVDPTSAASDRAPSGWQRLMHWGGALLTQRFPLADGDRVASRLLPMFGWMFSLPAAIGWALLVTTGVGLVWQHAQEFEAELNRIFDQQLWMPVLLIWATMKALHECGHAVCAKRHGVRVGRMGVMLFLCAPLAYVDVTDAWKLVRRRDRIQIGIAGVYLELAVAAVAAWCWWSLPLGFLRHLAAQVFLIAGPATLLINANPLLRLDGYYVLSDWLEIPNLRYHGRRRLLGLLERLLFGLPMPACPLPGWRADFAVAHAACSVVFQFVWMAGLVVAIASWAEGLGIFLGIVATMLWGVIPLVRWMHRIWTIQPASGLVLSVYQRRLIAVCSLALLMGHYAAVETSPFARRIPVVVRYENEQVARAPVDAFVTSVLVQCGQRVQKGALLMVLDHPELDIRRDQLLDRRDAALAKSIQYRRRGEIALGNAESDRAASYDRQIAELNEQLESLRVIAKRDGRITSPQTESMVGRYVSAGEELLRLSDPHQKEILALVAEDDLDSYRKTAQVGAVASIRLRGGVSLRAPLADLQPAANRNIPHAALAATAGGPLAVQTVGDQRRARSVKPHLQSAIPLDSYTSLKVRAGQIGRLTIPDNRTLLSRVIDRMRESTLRK